jgi:SAM-dependent methyltransferase
MPREKNIAVFDADAAGNAGYLYTKAGHLSGRMANGRISRCARELFEFKGKRVLDVGCGDGTYTAEYLGLGAKEVLGVDAAAEAIRSAQKRTRGRKGIRFKAMDVYAAKPLAKPFDVMVLRGLLHHLYDAPGAIKALAGQARHVLVIEPNGYNPVLKVIEKTSPYHIEHEEKSYPPHRLQGWFEAHGAVLLQRRYIGLVPFFCPGPLARILKFFEPLVEALPLLRSLSCAQVVLLFEIPTVKAPLGRKGGA